MNPSIVTGWVIAGSGLSSEIVQVWVIGSKPGTGMFWLPAVEAGISKTMLSTPGFGSSLAAMIAFRSVPGPESPVLVTTKVSAFGGVLLVMVNVAKAIEPRVAPPPGWLKVRLTVEKVVGRLGLGRIGIENVSSV